MNLPININVKIKFVHAVLILLTVQSIYAQDVSLFQQFNGKYDYTFIGNTMNSAENNVSPFYITGTSSAANLSLNPGDTVAKAYLYWAGSGDGDFIVDLNGVSITAERTFSHTRLINETNFTYFSAFKDITSIITSTGNGTYTLSNLDISAFEPLHFTRKTNFAGWAILIVYQNANLPLNQLNIYDGLQGVPDNLQINLTNLFVIDNSGATAGFIGWEGDSQLPTETFKVNNIALSNPQNPINNVFNSTNSITGATNLFNMDLDVYDIEDFIEVGDTNATITLSSSQDFIMINTVVTKLNSQLPDATATINSVNQSCDSRNITVNFSISNLNATAIIPAQTPVSIYANNVLLTTILIPNSIAINGVWSSSVQLTIPIEVGTNFTLKINADDNGQNQSTLIEINETNNTATNSISLWLSPNDIILEAITSCNQGNTKGTFDLSPYFDLLSSTTNNTNFYFYETESDAQNEQNPIQNVSFYNAITTPKQIYFKIKNENCEVINSFLLVTKNCPPKIYNYVTGNNDGFNDTFFIDGLRDIFTNFEIEIYNRWGRLVWTGNNTTENWNGYSNQGVIASKEKCPSGVYFYILKLNDENFPKPMIGWILFEG